MEFKISWPTDMNGAKLSFGDIIHDITLDCDFGIDCFELRGDLNSPLWYVNSGDGKCVNLKNCYKVDKENKFYRMNISGELAQAKYCKTLEELEDFCKEHNFHCLGASIHPNGFPRVEGYMDDGDVEITFKVQSRY